MMMKFDNAIYKSIPFVMVEWVEKIAQELTSKENGLLSRTLTREQEMYLYRRIDNRPTRNFNDAQLKRDQKRLTTLFMEKGNGKIKLIAFCCAVGYKKGNIDMIGLRKMEELGKKKVVLLSRVFGIVIPHDWRYARHLIQENTLTFVRAGEMFPHLMCQLLYLWGKNGDRKFLTARGIPEINCLPPPMLYKNFISCTGGLRDTNAKAYYTVLVASMAWLECYLYRYEKRWETIRPNVGYIEKRLRWLTNHVLISKEKSLQLLESWQIYTQGRLDKMIITVAHKYADMSPDHIDRENLVSLANDAQVQEQSLKEKDVKEESETPKKDEKGEDEKDEEEEEEGDALKDDKKQLYEILEEDEEQLREILEDEILKEDVKGEQQHESEILKEEEDAKEREGQQQSEDEISKEDHE